MTTSALLDTPRQAEPLLEVKNLSVTYSSPSGPVTAVDDVSFTINKGEVLGLAGESGCGKTSVALSLMRLHAKNATIRGEIFFRGRDVLQLSGKELRDYRWKSVSMIPQGSMNSLDPVMTIENQIVEAIRTHDKKSVREAGETVNRLLTAVSIPPARGKNYPHEFSGGMKQRAVIAMALALEPHLVVADEPTTALDVIVQRQLLNLLKYLREQLKISFIFVSHDLSVIGEIADRVAVMYAGKIVEIGDKVSILSRPSHPYTEALINSVPRVFDDRRALTSIPGDPPSGRWPPGCRFNPRCKFAFDLCTAREPPLEVSPTGTQAACHLITHPNRS